MESAAGDVGTSSILRLDSPYGDDGPIAFASQKV